MDNTSDFTVRLETLSQRTVLGYMCANVLFMLLFVGVSTRYGPHMDTHEVLVSKNKLENNSTLNMHARIRGMTLSSRNMDILLQFERQNGMYGASGIPIVLAQTTIYGITESDIQVFGEDAERVNSSQIAALPSLHNYMTAHQSAHVVQVTESGSNSSAYHVGHKLATEEAVRLVVMCSKGKWCEPTRPLMHFPVIDYVGYNLNIRLTFPEHAIINTHGLVRLRRSYGSVEATRYLLGAKLTFLCLSIACCICWFWRICSVPLDRWSREQFWIGVLTATLILFNDPFYIVQLSSNFLGPSLYIVSTIGQASFWASLLLFWLIALDNFRLEA